MTELLADFNSVLSAFINQYPDLEGDIKELLNGKTCQQVLFEKEGEEKAILMMTRGEESNLSELISDLKLPGMTEELIEQVKTAEEKKQREEYMKKYDDLVSQNPTLSITLPNFELDSIDSIIERYTELLNDIDRTK